MDGLNSRQIFLQGKTRCEKKNIIAVHCKITAKIFNHFFTCCTFVAPCNIISANANPMDKQIGKMYFQRPSSNCSRFMIFFFFISLISLRTDIPNKEEIFEVSVKMSPIAK